MHEQSMFQVYESNPDLLSAVPGSENLYPLTIQGAVTVAGMTIPNIVGGFGPGRRVMLAKTIAEMFGMEVKRVNETVNRNREKFENGIDILDVKGTSFEVEICDHGIMTQNALNRAAHIWIFSEKGLMNLCTQVNNPRAWEKYIQMRDEYFEMRERTADLSPQLKWMIEQELRQKELERRQQQYERRLDMIQQQTHKLRDSIAETREVMEVIRSEKWRERMNTMVRQIAGKAFNRDHSACRRELYKELERRAHCDVTRRLMNYKERLKQNGYTKTAVDKANMLDVIEMDDRLREIFTLIVKEAYIKYCG